MISRNIFAMILILSLAGLALASYQTQIHFAENDYACGVADSCNLVTKSKYSELFGIPAAIIGVAGFAGLAGLSILGAAGRMNTKATFKFLFGLSTIGMAFVAYFVYIELFKVHAICNLCTCSHILGTSIWGASLFGIAMSRRSKIEN